MIILFLLLLSPLSHGDQEISLGALTYHLFNPGGVSKEYKGHIGLSDSLILHPLISYRQTTDDPGGYTSWAAFGGLNSVRDPLAGAAQSTGLYLNNRKMMLGFMLGGYIQDNRGFLEREIYIPYSMPIGKASFVPIVGLEMGLRTGDRTRVWIITTPATITTLIGVSF